MGSKLCRPGALMNYMLKGLQHWTPLADPYDEVLFPKEVDEKVKPGLPNRNYYCFVKGAEQTVASILNNLDPNNTELREASLRFMDLCQDITSGFTALGISRVLPNFLQFLVKKRVDRLMTFASMTVRDVQYAMLNLGYTKEDLLRRGCPRAPDGPEPDPTIRRLKAVLTHPIGDYAVQPRDATSKFSRGSSGPSNVSQLSSHSVFVCSNLPLRSGSTRCYNGPLHGWCILLRRCNTTDIHS